MNRTRTIALFAGIFAIAMTTYGLTGVSASPMIMSSIIPQTQEEVSTLGHVEFTVFDNNGLIKSYTQSDNVVVYTGKDCAGELIFGSDGGNSACAINGATFDYIAIGNSTSVAADAANTELSGGQCATTATAGELARKQVTPTNDVGASGSGGTEVILDVGLDTFKFEANNATSGTTVTQSGLFNANNGIGSDGECASYSNSSWDMFAVRDISVAVSSGDSLAVKWTITLN